MKHLRWWIGGLLFAVTVINYIDRQSVSVLAPILQQEYRWSNSGFATILIAFRVAYTVTQSAFGRVLDWLGTRRGVASSSDSRPGTGRLGWIRAYSFIYQIEGDPRYPELTSVVFAWVESPGGRAPT